jgi:UDP-N-acetylglucosamine 2-epimerase (non-hydrolysing)
MLRGEILDNIGVLIGTRPEAIKLMPVIHTLEARGLQPKVLITGQHRELLDPILTELGIDATENLHVMEEDQSLEDLSSRLLKGMRDLLHRHRIDTLIVQGDTTTVAMGALACFYANIKVAHVEAGLRTHIRRNPFPEEMNRRMVACLADTHFAPTITARENLLKEGIPPEQIHVVGNTVVDALFFSRDRLIPELAPSFYLEKIQSQNRKVILVTGHRRESFGADLKATCQGIRRLAEYFKDEIEIVYPVHLNPNVQTVVGSILGSVPNVRLIYPLTYLRFVEVMLNSKLIITDSGGVQEEAAALGIPVLITRRTCERLEAVEAGTSQLVGPDPNKIFETANDLLTNQETFERRAVPTDVFGDGFASQRIAEILLKS